MAQILDRSITQGFYHTVACEDGGLDKNKIIKTEHRHPSGSLGSANQEATPILESALNRF